MAAIEGSFTWRATRPVRDFFRRHPALRRNVQRAIRLAYWSFSGQLPRRYKLWRGKRAVDAQKTCQIPYNLPNISAAAAPLAARLSEGGQELAAADYVSKLVIDELAATSWRLDTLFQILDSWPDAEAVLAKAAALRPSDPNFHDMLGLICLEQRKMSEAIAHFKASIAVAPDRVVARINLAAALLFSGDAAGSVQVSRAATTLTEEFYVYLLLSSALAKRDGLVDEAIKILDIGLGVGSERKTISAEEDVRGKTAVLKLTMGAGDIIIALPAIERLALAGARVLLHIESPRDRSLEALLLRCPGVAGIISLGECLPPSDYYVELYRQFLAMGAPVSSRPWLFPASERVAAWQARLAPVSGLKIGIVWAGDTQPTWRGFRVLSHVQRRCPAEKFNGLAGIPGVSLISLQMGAAAKELESLNLQALDLSSQIADYADTAAIVANLDLVISVDTSVAHLAGAMGKPVWTLLHYDSIFFFWDREDSSSWYPSARVFRQATPGDWDGVFARVESMARDEQRAFESRVAAS